MSDTEKLAELLAYTESRVRGEIDELVDLGAADELWRLFNYLWDRIPARPQSQVQVLMADFDKAIAELAA